MTSLLVFHLFILDKVLVKGLHSTYVEPLNCILTNTLQLNWEQNSTYQLQFTAYDDQTVAFNLIDIESSVYFEGQEYIIKQCLPDFNNKIELKQVTATHIYNEIGRIRQRTVKTGTLTYTVNDVLAFYLAKNNLGFTYKVIGNFDKAQITDLGNDSGKDMLSKIVSAWPNAVIYPDNKLIQVYSNDVWAKDYGNRIDYLNNTNEVKLTYDSTDIVNQIMVSGKTKDDSGDKTTYYFPPHLVSDNNSINKWGLHPGSDLSDERFTDAGAMDKYALTQMAPEPTLTIDVTYSSNDKPTAGESRRLEIRDISFVTKVQVVAYTWYPFDQSVQTQITLNNTAKTILDYQNNARSLINKAINNQKKIDGKANAAMDIANTAKSQADDLTKKVADLEDKINHLIPPKPTQTNGLDVSELNTDIDWAKLKATGHTFVMILAGYSTTQDKLFEKHMQNAINVGFDIGLYLFSYACNVTDAKAEADFVCSLADKYKNKITYPIAWDWETDSETYAKKQGITPTQQLVSDMAVTFLTEVKAKGYQVLNYSNLDYYNRYFDSRVKAYDWWLARPSVTTPDVPCKMWQDEMDVDGTGRGVNGKADFDISYL
ncbi:phage tail protein [Melissococcus plutonius]|uniref:phage tail protein n=1 Tax=Melissococcus plutonius TaxID=33970 RepID=UPI003C2DC09F